MSVLSANQILITNEDDQCVEEYNLNTGEISPFAAACDGTAGSSYTGHRKNDVSMDVPMGVLYDGDQKVYVTIYYAMVVLSIDTTTDQSSVLLTTTSPPRLLGYGQNSDIVHITFNNGFGAIKDGSVEYIIGTSGQSTGKAIGDISTTQMSHPRGFVEVDNGTWVVADRQNHR